MRCSLWLTCALNAVIAYAATTPSRTISKRQTVDSSQFITSAGGRFSVNGSDFKFVGTNAYWLPFLNSDDDISNALGNMSAAGVKVVRTWAFNDVTSIPANGTWFQLIANGTATINNGTNGLQRLDRVVQLAQDHGIYVLFSMTNNWNPLPNVTNSTTPTPISNVTNPAPGPALPTPLPPGFLSNSYGGMDAYVREFGMLKQHDEFFSNETIKNIFKNYTNTVISRFANNPFVFAWELANDARCNSTIETSDECNTLTVTGWHADLASFVRTVDPNHMVSSGNQGFFCPDCQKMFPLTPPPQPSPAPGARRRSVSGAMTKARLMRDILDKRRKAKKAAAPDESADRVKIRGRWSASANAKRQTSPTNGMGSAFDGSHGVDGQDILNIPDIGFGTFQYFPDQNTYSTDNQAPAQPAPSSTSSPNFDLQTGLDWINNQVASAQAVGKPLALTGFGLVSQDNSQVFVPFNSTAPNITATNSSAALPENLSTEQQLFIYDQLINAGIAAGVHGLLQYQWSSFGLQAQAGTLVPPAPQAPVGTPPANGSATDNQGPSPNDGYGNSDQAGQAGLAGLLSDANGQLNTST